MLRAAAVGLALGLAWGAAARVWMRLLTTTPEFSWAGTAFILGLAGLLGTGLGIAVAARADHRRLWWLLAIVPGLLLFAGQGMPFLPAFALGGLLASRRALLRMVCVLAVVAPAVMLWRTSRLDEVHMLPAPTSVQVATLVGFPVLAGALAWSTALLWRAGRVAAQSDSPERAPRVQGSSVAAQSDSPERALRVQGSSVAAQSDSPERALNSRRSDSSLEAPAGPA